MRYLSYFLLFSSLMWSVTTSASIVITGTRVIYPSDAKNVSVHVSNEGKQPALIQSWIDKGEQQTRPEKITVPFLLNPPINRIEPGKGQTLKIQALSPSLPTDRESIFWLNVLEIPPVSKDLKSKNYIQIAFRSRIKLFYRPAGLEGASDSASKLQWSPVSDGIRAYNPTPFYISLIKVKIGNKSLDGQMIAPFSSAVFKTTYAKGANTLIASSLNDYGAIINNQYSF